MFGGYAPEPPNSAEGESEESSDNVAKALHDPDSEITIAAEALIERMTKHWNPRSTDRVDQKVKAVNDEWVDDGSGK
jgi:uncharacterized membrane protein